ncbi:hypothetical protein RHMOL_Rhmol03G0057700 [Rhododendron molle]|uniref:Uncharacterized protein n=1 Tax=Rhododendron molle TaxID=49168 RepID=A0ACC0PB50_RHOML|nr:hypothetical protein RHMOL_Rhmol03G0057700 [Rhododendron molle]
MGGKKVGGQNRPEQQYGGQQKHGQQHQYGQQHHGGGQGQHKQGGGIIDKVKDKIHGGGTGGTHRNHNNRGN